MTTDLTYSACALWPPAVCAGPGPPAGLARAGCSLGEAHLLCCLPSVKAEAGSTTAADGEKFSSYSSLLL